MSAKRDDVEAIRLVVRWRSGDETVVELEGVEEMQLDRHREFEELAASGVERRYAYTGMERVSLRALGRNPKIERAGQAAAPELAEALEELLEVMDSPRERPSRIEAISRARAALEKAGLR